LLALLTFEKDTPLDMTTDGEVLRSCLVRDDHSTRMRAVALRMIHVHDAALMHLAE